VALYAPQDALLYAKSFIKSMPILTADSANLQYKIADYAHRCCGLLLPGSGPWGSLLTCLSWLLPPTTP